MSTSITTYDGGVKSTFNFPSINTTDTIATVGQSQTFSGNNTFSGSNAFDGVTGFNALVNCHNQVQFNDPSNPISFGNGIGYVNVNVSGYPQGVAVTIPAVDGTLSTLEQAQTFSGDLTFSGSNTFTNQNTYGNGVQNPSAAPVASTVANTGSVLTGTYNYVITFINNNNLETGVSATSNSVVYASGSTSGSVSFAIGPNNVSKRNIYRNKSAALTPLYLLTTISDNTTTTFADNVADTSLGVQAPTSNSTFPNQTLNGNLTITDQYNQLVIGSGQTSTISVPTPSANRVYTLSDAGADGDIVISSAANVFTANQTFNNNVSVNGELGLFDTTSASPMYFSNGNGYLNVKPSSYPASGAAITIPAVTDTLASLGQTQTFTGDLTFQGTIAASGATEFSGAVDFSNTVSLTNPTNPIQFSNGSSTLALLPSTYNGATITIPAVTDTLATLAATQTFSGNDVFSGTIHNNIIDFSVGNSLVLRKGGIQNITSRNIALSTSGAATTIATFIVAAGSTASAILQFSLTGTILGSPTIVSVYSGVLTVTIAYDGTNYNYQMVETSTTGSNSTGAPATLTTDWTISSNTILQLTIVNSSALNISSPQLIYTLTNCGNQDITIA